MRCLFKQHLHLVILRNRFLPSEINRADSKSFLKKTAVRISKNQGPRDDCKAKIRPDLRREDLWCFPLSDRSHIIAKISKKKINRKYLGFIPVSELEFTWVWWEKWGTFSPSAGESLLTASWVWWKCVPYILLNEIWWDQNSSEKAVSSGWDWNVVRSGFAAVWHFC